MQIFSKTFGIIIEIELHLNDPFQIGDIGE